MYLDKENMFSQAQAVTATAAGTNTVDMGKGDIGPSEDLSLFVNAGTAFTGAGTLVVELQTADAVNAATGALVSPVSVATYPVSNAALVLGGKLVSARLPHGMKRYAGVTYTVSGTLAAGKVTAGFVRDAQASF